MSESIGAKELATLAKRRGLHVPAAEHRVDRRGFWQFFEVRERWGGADPRKYEDITLWFQGKNNTPGTPQGAQVWLDLCRWCGHDPRPYNAIAATDQCKLSVEHWLMSKTKSLRRAAVTSGTLRHLARTAQPTTCAASPRRRRPWRRPWRRRCRPSRRRW